MSSDPGSRRARPKSDIVTSNAKLSGNIIEIRQPARRFSSPLYFHVEEWCPRNAPPPKFLPEKHNIFYASKIEIEGDDATRHWDGSKANHINATVVEPNPYAAHEVTERIAASAFYACAKPCGSIHVALLIAGSGGSARGSQSTTCLILERGRFD
jgi:hypothetical protein